jgi:hypothetical protein
MGQVNDAKAKFSQPIEDVIDKKLGKITYPKTNLLNFFKAAPCQEVELDIQRFKD